MRRAVALSPHRQHGVVGRGVAIGERERVPAQRAGTRAPALRRGGVRGLPPELDRADHLEQRRGQRARPGGRRSRSGRGVGGGDAVEHLSERAVSQATDRRSIAYGSHPPRTCCGTQGLPDPEGHVIGLTRLQA